MPATNLCPLTNDYYGMRPFLSPQLEAAPNLALTTVGLLGDWGQLDLARRHRVFFRFCSSSTNCPLS